MSYRGRFAPSPTGLLHFGSLVAALGSWLCARHAQGKWLVRMEDIDPPREAPGSAATILTGLSAFGLIADEPTLFQSQRVAAYDAAFEQLQAKEQVFPCWCSRSDLLPTAGIHRDARCVATPDSERTPAWRMRVPDIDIAFDDALQGTQRQNLREHVGDFVVRRVEGFYSYQLTCVVDDAWQNITDVVRGYDLLESTPRQLWLQQALGLPTPRYLHLPLALDTNGHKLSKSEGAHAICPANPVPALQRALAFLNVPTVATAADVTEVLAAAAAHFDPQRLPQCSGRSMD